MFEILKEKSSPHLRGSDWERRRREKGENTDLRLWRSGPGHGGRIAVKSGRFSPLFVFTWGKGHAVCVRTSTGPDHGLEEDCVVLFLYLNVLAKASGLGDGALRGRGGERPEWGEGLAVCYLCVSVRRPLGRRSHARRSPHPFLFRLS